jgi:hypothetical protein
MPASLRMLRFNGIEFEFRRKLPTISFNSAALAKIWRPDGVRPLRGWQNSHTFTKNGVKIGMNRRLRVNY